MASFTYDDIRAVKRAVRELPLPCVFQEPLDLIVRADQEKFHHIIGFSAKQNPIMDAGTRFPNPLL